MAHCIVPEAEEILDREFPVLDKGFVRLVDYLGGDERIVQAARVSYGKGTKSYREDKGLIAYLLRNQHTSPFEQVVFTFHVKLPVFVARQWIRHRTARLNEISGRYSVLKDEFYLPDALDLAAQSTDNKQGRAGEALEPEAAQEALEVLRAGQKRAYEDYSSLLRTLAREIARINLPLSVYTEWYWQIDLHNLLHFLKLRMDAHAQKEIRLYAEVLYGIMKKVSPLTAQAFDEHVLGAVSFSAQEFAALKNLLRGENLDAAGLTEKEAARFQEKLGL
ncbi:MAG: FAD-dependent thymidylate synthase [Spirochaetales bacterium]|jgi:thymidylate synthase (FAD)|nr:FAD-dependent thymidylate synthase [Spirochaetales bacterium]